MYAFVLSTLLSADPTAGVSLGATELNAINLDPKLVHFYEEHLAQHLGYFGVRVTSANEIAAKLGVERQKVLLGCTGDEANSCATELIGALHADGLLLGDIARHAGGFQINLKVISGSGSELLASYSARTEDEEAVLGLLTTAAGTLAKDLYAKLERGPAPAPATTTVVARGSTVRRLALVPAAAGLVMVAVGVVLQVLAESEWSRLHPVPGATLSLEEGSRAVAAGRSYQLWSGVLLSAGAAAALAAGAMFVFGGESTKVTAMLAPDGGGVAISGVWP